MGLQWRDGGSEGAEVTQGEGELYGSEKRTRGTATNVQHCPQRPSVLGQALFPHGVSLGSYTRPTQMTPRQPVVPKRWTLKLVLRESISLSSKCYSSLILIWLKSVNDILTEFLLSAFTKSTKLLFFHLIKKKSISSSIQNFIMVYALKTSRPPKLVLRQEKILKTALSVLLHIR